MYPHLVLRAHESLHEVIDVIEHRLCIFDVASLSLGIPVPLLIQRDTNDAFFREIVKEVDFRLVVGMGAVTVDEDDRTFDVTRVA